jgi:imidazolonepropionase-like amidohydrolase
MNHRSRKHDYLLKDVTLIDVNARELLPGRTVRIRDGMIENIAGGSCSFSGSESYDAAGCYLLPGIIDAHVHLIWDGSSDPLKTMKDEGLYLSLVRGIHNAQKSLVCGVTTVRDLGSADDIAVEIERSFARDLLFGPGVVPAGRMIQPANGHVPDIGLIAETDEELRAAVLLQKERGAALIKVAVTGGAYGPEEIGPVLYDRQKLETLVESAHEKGLRIAAHCLGKSGVAAAVDAGFDTIEHGAGAAEDTLREMKKRGTILIPTLAVYRRLAMNTDGIPELYAKKAGTVVSWHRDMMALAGKIGIVVALGTDAGSPGLGGQPSVFEEMETMIEYGMDTWDVIAAATKNAASALGMSKEIGSIDEGKKADILLVRDNPLEDIRALRNLEKVIKEGVML